MQGVSTARLPGATVLDVKATGSRIAIGKLIAVLALAVVLFTLAYIPRTMILGSYLTTDEGNWMGRTALFTQGILRGDPYATYQSGHPGVTTMWTALAGMGVDRALGLVEYVRPDGLEKAPDYLDTLRQARKWFPVVTSLAVALVGLLAWRLAGPAIGILSAVLVGLEPFFLAHSVVAHLDGALTAYMTLSALCALIYFWADGGRGYLVGCAVATALAFLTKAPASFLALFVPFLAGLSLVPAHRRTMRELRGVMFSLAVWGLIIGAITLVLWPAFRADPIWAIRSMIDYTEAVGGSDHENFFLGQPVADPGPLYYLVTVGFRLTPITVIGLALLPLGLLLSGKERRRYVPFVGFLCAFILLFWAMMALPPKKFDRYMLPVFPSLEMLAAIGYWLVIRRFANRFVSLALGVATIGLGVLQILPGAMVHPYYLAYYNPLFGGGPAAAKAFVVGWGEGLDIVASYLNSRPEAERLTVSGFYPRVLMAQFKGTVLPDKQYDPAQADYLVLYINAVQRDLADRLRTEARGRRSELRVQINGIEYARLVRVPPPAGRSPVGTEFDNELRLERTYMKSEARRYLKSDNLHAGDTLEFTLRWRLLQPVSSDHRLTLQLMDRSGRVVSESGGQIGTIGGATTAILPGQETLGVYRLAIPDVSGEFWIALGVEDADGHRSAITAWPEKLNQDARRLGDRVMLENIDVRPAIDPEAE
jgi:4-amino-4-deoxy-L-arabinose transferase-like glycosyltransferase